MKNVLVLLLATASLAGCTSVAVSTPSPIVEPSEIYGESGKLGFSVRVHSDQIYEATENGNTRPPDLTQPKVHEGASAFAGAHLNLLNRIKLGLNLDPNAEPQGFGGFASAQIQLLGSDRKSGKGGNFSFSIFGHAGSSKGEAKGDQSTTFGPGGQDWKGEVKSGWYDFGASLGYRVAEKTLIFLGVSKQLVFLNTKIDQSGGAPPQGTYNASDRGEGNKAAFGISWISSEGEFFISADYTDYRYHKAGNSFAPGGSVGFIYR